jgi:hypothetical protein
MTTSLINILTDAAGNVAAGSSSVQEVRDRLGAAVHDGYSVVDSFTSSTPGLFLLGTAGSALCSYALAKRKTTEARILYSIAGVVSLVLAFMTRPNFLRTQAQIAPAATPGAAAAPGAVVVPGTAVAVQGFIGNWLDGRVATLSAEDPQFATTALRRLLADTALDQVPGVSNIVGV